ncbi:unnamed protein product [Penicillium nalgiovense]|nr:unnamed protein product [Penicillium nalgiovense]
MSSGKGIYFLPSNFIHHSGHNLLFWTVLFLSVSAVLLFEFTVSTLRALFFPTDVDIFQEYEQDLEIRKRFEEAAASELQQGWDHGNKRSSFEIARENAEKAEMDARERQVRELLARPRVMDTKELEVDTASATVSHNSSVPSHNAETDRGRQSGLLCPEDANGRRRSAEIQELFSKGYGAVRKGQLK